jgi:phage baseplate assembly protein W
MPYKSLELTPTQYNAGYTDQTSQFYRGFSTIDSTANDVRLYDNALIKQDILNQFQIRRGERVMMPKFGTVIWDMLYEPLTDTAKSLIQKDVTRICTSDPRVTCQQIDIVQSEYGFLLEITLIYVNSNQSDTIKLNFNKETGLNI